MTLRQGTFHKGHELDHSPPAMTTLCKACWPESSCPEETSSALKITRQKTIKCCKAVILQLINKLENNLSHIISAVWKCFFTPTVNSASISMGLDLISTTIAHGFGKQMSVFLLFQTDYGIRVLILQDPRRPEIWGPGGLPAPAFLCLPGLLSHHTVGHTLVSSHRQSLAPATLKNLLATSDCYSYPVSRSIISSQPSLNL